MEFFSFRLIFTPKHILVMIESQKQALIKYRKSEKFKNWQREYRKKRSSDPVIREKLLKQKRENARKNIITHMLAAAKKRALKNNIDFSLTKEDIYIPDICPLLEIPIFPGDKSNYFNSPSIDRIDNNFGYSKENIRIISSLANTMKNCASTQQLLTFCKNIPNYLLSNDIVRTVENQESTELEDKELLG